VSDAAPEGFFNSLFSRGATVMQTFHIDCELDYEVQQQSLFVFNLGVPSTPTQRVVAERMSTSPPHPLDEFRDEAGRNRFVRLDVPPGPFNIRYLATVEVEPPDCDELARETPLPELPGQLLSYVQGSRYCEVEAIYSFAVRKFGNLPPGYQRVRSICRWVKEHVDYQIGTSTPSYTARDVLANRAGVCRDFAHVVIALCRALNIPSRFVTAYTKYQDPPPDFHAVAEVFLEGRWYLFDPTELAPIGNLVRLGTGRDASEVPFATFFGAARLLRLSPLVEPASGKEILVPLQTATSGIVLGPAEERSVRGH
jgi:transglutaminase-like putative cysteine protease